jgi:predicted ribosome quality control (RQC) complex YloA/Tae2 family protein
MTKSIKPFEHREPDVFEYKLPGNWIVLAGKTSLDNELLSLKKARQNDLWFHVHGMSGSHVIIQSKPDEEPNKDTIRKAAAIAAYHSKARAGGKVSVSYTKAVNVSKPRGSKQGTVSIRREAIIKVRPALPDK